MAHGRVPESDFTFINPVDLNGITEGSCQVLGHRWWLMRGEEIAFYKRMSPQCNADRVIAKRIALNYEWCTEVRFIERVAVPTRHYDNGDWDYALPKASS
jgi:hypothetical protein